MAIGYYQDYWHYTDPAGKEYTTAEFQKYLDEHHPKEGYWDYSTHTAAERDLIEKGGWKKTQNPPTIPSLEEVAGKYLLVSQHAEPRTYIWDKDHRSGHWHVFNYSDLDTEWWRMARPDVIDSMMTRWGHSCWLINKDGTLEFAGANYDSSD